MSHGRIAKTKFMIYWKTNLKWTLKNKNIGKKNKNRLWPRFSFYKAKLNIFKKIFKKT